ncbi:hypothetical protein BDM02DRAFT_3103524, partial [Thelephora ganbajun]
PGSTKALNFYQVNKSPGKAVLVNAPGCGSGSRLEWGELIDHHYIDNRKELRRVFVLSNGGHGFDEINAMML